MKYVYICGAVPEKVNDAQGGSVAGNKFSLNMAKALDKALGGGLEFFTTAQLSEDQVALAEGEIWAGKSLNILKSGKRFLINELVQQRSLAKALRYLRKINKNEKITVIIENSPFVTAPVCAKLKKSLDLSIFSITIDTPFTKAFSSKGVRGRINKWKFSEGFRALKNFDGLISFTEDVKKELQVEVPFCQLAIGCEKSKIIDSADIPATNSEAPFKVVYAGTLIYYNGIKEMLDAFARLPKHYELHIYGYGPLAEDVEKMAEENENIVFHGRFAPEDTMRILNEYDLLLNPRIIDPSIENFTFPSKLIDYLLTGKSVLTSRFKTLPEAYYDFVYTIDKMSAEGIANAVEGVFSDSVELRRKKSETAINYLKNYQTYDKIAEGLIGFMETHY